jgi:starch synthase
MASEAETRNRPMERRVFAGPARPVERIDQMVRQQGLKIASAVEHISPSVAPRILFASAEAFPLAKTGGLGDVCSALPACLARLSADIRLMIPGYPQALDVAVNKRLVVEFTDVGGEENCKLVAGHMPDSGIPVLLLDAPRLFRRSGGLYQDSGGSNWHDNHRRFAVFCHAVARVALGEAGLAWRPEIVHANDWHTGLVPAL